MSPLFSAIAIAASLTRLVLFTLLHFARSGYDPVAHAVSDYAIGKTARLSCAMSWVAVVTWLSLAGAVWSGLPDWDYRPTAVILLLVLAVIFVILPFVPTDLEGEQRTRRGLLHYALAIAWFAVAYSLTGDLSRFGTRHWSDWMGATLTGLHLVAMASLIALVIALVVGPLRRYFGLAERVFLMAISLFYLFAAVGILMFA